KQLRDVSASYRGWQPRLNMLVVVAGRPVLGSAETVARRLATGLRLPMPVVCDPGDRMARAYCDWPLRTPFSVLIDPAGIVRLVQEGYETDEYRLSEHVNGLLDDKPFGQDVVRRESVLYGRRMPDAHVTVGGRRVQVSSLW